MKQRKQIIFASSQPKWFHLMYALKDLIEIYNNDYKNDEDFLPVKLMSHEQTLAKSEHQLALETIDKIEQNNPESPNIILSDKYGALFLKRKNKILDINSDLKELINQEILDFHNSEFCQDYQNKKVYDLPFNITNLDTIIFNLNIMNRLFELIKEGGGFVDEQSSIFVKSKNSIDKENSLAKKSFFNLIKVKDKDIFKGWKVDDSTFRSIENALEFSSKFWDGVFVDSDLVDQSTLNATIFSMDYHLQLFLKSFDNYEQNLSNYQDIKLWNLSKTKDEIIFNFKDPQVKLSLEKIYNTYKQNLRNVEIKNKNFSSIKYLGFDDGWTNTIIRSYQCAFAFGPSVGKRNLSWKKEENLALKKDVLHERQVRFFSDKNKEKTTYFKGGSSLVLIDTNQRENRATLKFVNWLYNGKIESLNMNVSDFIIENSGYFLPLKTIINKQFLKELEQKLKDKKILIEKTSDEKLKDKLFIQANYLESSILSLADLLDYLNLEKSKIDILYYPANQKTFEVISYIKNALEKWSKNIEKSQDESFEKFYEHLLKLTN
ncbi:P68 family surface lipoprotein [Mycoplasmopsis pulmonis]|uniref:P68 family surface lipoprotein n=1 Tax=Mycoplasmopsis pulmonis TaxID=2107 RepID=UPI00100516A8|nr:hypothetical protein [Mycoplasmopsis pulmonis]VEU67875.1 Uncharacterised protein [Mycoplasmopsis pulmonis]